MDPAGQTDPTFTRLQLLACVPGLSEPVFAQWIARGVMQLSESGAVGKGNRRRYSVSDVLQAGMYWELSRLGFVVSKGFVVWQLVQLRMAELEAGGPLLAGPGFALALAVHPSTGELLSRGFNEAEPVFDPADEDAPDTLVIFRVDRFIARMVERMEAVTAERQPAPPPDPTRVEHRDFLRRWTTDAEGRRVLVGLTADETAEYERYSGAEDDIDGDRFLALHDKHEAARQARIAAEGKA